MSVRSRSAGFTLVETSLAVFHGTTRVRVSNAAFEVGALYTAAQMRATRMGVPHSVVCPSPCPRVP